MNGPEEEEDGAGYGPPCEHDGDGADLELSSIKERQIKGPWRLATHTLPSSERDRMLMVMINEVDLDLLRRQYHNVAEDVRTGARRTAEAMAVRPTDSFAGVKFLNDRCDLRSNLAAFAESRDLLLRERSQMVNTGGRWQLRLVGRWKPFKRWSIEAMMMMLCIEYKA